MELGGRELLIALGALLILAILLDGLRRMRRAGRGKLKVRQRRTPIFDDDCDEFGSELPTGKSRVVEVRDEHRAEQVSNTIKQNAEVNACKLTTPFREAPAREGSEHDLHQAAPESSIDTVAYATEEVDPIDAAREAAEAAEPTSDPVDPSPEGPVEQDQAPAFYVDAAEAVDERLADTDSTPVEVARGQSRRGGREPQQDVPRSGRQGSLFDDDAMPETTLEAAEEIVPERSSARGKRRKPHSAGTVADRAQNQGNGNNKNGMPVLVVLHLMARNGEHFAGDKLLQSALDNGLRYGSRKIFHRDSSGDGSGDILFSMANSVNPGTFDLDRMEQFETPGVTFMLMLDDLDDPLTAFNQMLETVHCLNQELDGVIQDEQHSALSRQTAEHYRQRIIDFRRAQLSAAH